ncbi:MAG: hypothetical protein ABGW78_15050 [Pirellulales bacterium]
MATQRTVVQSLSIALIVFVMFTFILAVTTYLGFKGKFDAEEQTKAANESAASANSELGTQRQNNQILIDAIGIAMTDPENPGSDNPEAAIDNWFTQRFGAFSEDPRSYEKLALWLQESIREKDTQLQERLIEKERLVSDAQKVAADEKKRADTASKRVTAVEDERKQAQAQFDQSVAEHQKQMQDLTQKLKDAQDESTQLEEIKQAVGRAEDVISARSLDNFKTASTVDRVTTILTELRERERAINRFNALLAKLRISDPQLQRTIGDSIPLDERIDGFDGRIISVNHADRTALVLSDSTRGMRPGLVFYVYSPDDPKPLVASRKGSVEVMNLESDTLVRMRIRSDSLGDPIVSGDGVATSLWEAGTQFTSVIVGFVQIDQDADSDQDRLEDLIQGVGGSVELSVTPLTTMIIDAGKPDNLGLEKPDDWGDRESKRRDRELREANRLGIQVVGIGEFMQMLGLRRDSLDANRLPDASVR